MNAAEVLSELENRGVAITTDGDRLRWRAPKGAMTPDLIQRAQAYKPAILALLTNRHECAIVERINRAHQPSDPGRCALCRESDGRGAVVLPFGTLTFGHVWLHAACWPAWYAQRKAAAERSEG